MQRGYAACVIIPAYAAKAGVFYHVRKGLLSWEAADRLHQILIAVFIARKDAAKAGDDVKAIGIIYRAQGFGGGR